jgi:hypothetical protein
MKHLALIIGMGLLLSGCKKDDTIEAGNVTLDVYVKHHNIPIPNARIFVKNNTLQFPGQDTSLYDTFYTTDAAGHYKMVDIGNGKKEMVIYAKGIDPSWDSTGTTPVWGFSTVSIETKPGEDKASSVTIAVSE